MVSVSFNPSAISTVSYLNADAKVESTALAQLASGKVINQSSQNAAGLAIVTSLNSSVNVLAQASTNVAQASAMLNTADSAAGSISDMLSRMQALAASASSATTVGGGAAFDQEEFAQLVAQVDETASGTRYAGVSLIGDSSPFSAGLSVLVGSSSSDKISLTLPTLTSAALGFTSTVDISNASDATAALAVISSAIDTVSSARAEIGATASRFNFAGASIDSQSQNLQAASAAIDATDVAATQAQLSSAQVQTSAAISALVTADALPQSLLKLLGN